jgi:hypothetical protein
MKRTLVKKKNPTLTGGVFSFYIIGNRRTRAQIARTNAGNITNNAQGPQITMLYVMPIATKINTIIGIIITQNSLSTSRMYSILIGVIHEAIQQASIVHGLIRKTS